MENKLLDKNYLINSEKRLKTNHSTNSNNEVFQINDNFNQQLSDSPIFGSDLSNYYFDNCLNEEDWDEIAVEESSPKLANFPHEINTIVFNYKLKKLLKCGKNCAVFVCHLKNDRNQTFIAKIAKNKEELKLRKEYNNYLLLGGGNGIPKLYFNHWWTETNVCDNNMNRNKWGIIVIEKLTNKFSNFSKPYTEDKLSLVQLVPMASQQIHLLEYIHSKGLIHRGVKPDNFVLSSDASKVYIIDFNRSKSYLKNNKTHCDFQEDRKLPTGNVLFHSLNYHNGIRRTRRDDMESLGLCWIYQLKGGLPWSEINRNTFNTYSDYIREVGNRVRKTQIEDLCKDLPKSFEDYLKTCRKLGFNEEPNYKEMQHFILNSIDQKSYDSNSDDSGFLTS